MFNYCSIITHAAKHIPLKPSRNDIIAELYASPEVTKAVNKMEPADLREDLKQEMFIELCKLEEDKLIGMYERNELRYFLVGVMWRMTCSNRSTFYTVHRKYNELLLDGMLTVLPNGDLARIGEDGETVEQTQAKHAEHVTFGPALAERVEIAFTKLDPYEADLFRLYTEMGQNTAKVARNTGIPVRSVGCAIAEAKRKLKKHLRNAH